MPGTARRQGVPTAPVLLQSSLTIIDTGNPMEYYLKPLSQSTQRRRQIVSNMSKLDEKFKLCKI